MSCTLSSPTFPSQATHVDVYFQTQQSQVSFMLLQGLVSQACTNYSTGLDCYFRTMSTSIPNPEFAVLLSLHFYTSVTSRMLQTYTHGHEYMNQIKLCYMTPCVGREEDRRKERREGEKRRTKGGGR